jgi:hypothetical protein
MEVFLNVHSGTKIGRNMNHLARKLIVALTLICTLDASGRPVSIWETVPKILTMSDAVNPGKSFRVNGFGFTDNDHLEMAIEKDIPGASAFSPSDGMIRPEIIQKDKNGNFLVAIMPATAMPGVYNIWIKNATGWSKPAKLNAARALFISEREAFKGLFIKLSGRNLDDREFGCLTGIQRTKIRLHSGSNGIYETRVTEVNPYCVTFQIQNEPKGVYVVEASNDNGLNWCRLDNGQQLTILEKPKGESADFDPLGLGVAWASHFNWKNVHCVPTSNGSRDVTGLIQSMIDTVAGEPHGGIVYFPDGVYKISRLGLRKNIVLKGESRTGTIISYCGHDKDFITCVGAAISDGHVGIANMSLIVPEEIKARPDVFINLGQAAIWQGVSNIHLRTASEMFIYNLRINYDYTETAKDRRGLPSSVIGNERYLIANCDFNGFRMESHNYVSDYITVKNNRFEYAQGVFIYTGNYLFLEDNHIIGHTEINREKHGFMLRANAYVYHNTVEHTGSEEGPLNENWNDGEAICNETPGGNHNFGSVKSATAGSLVVAVTAGPFVVPDVEIYNHESVMIVGGMGLGQYRRVSRIDTASKTILLEKKWDVLPDSSSRFTLIEPNENITYYRNMIRDNAKGYWLFGNSIDCVVAQDTSIDCDGIFLFSCMYINDDQPNPMYYFVPNYFNRITGNVVKGVSRKSHRAGIGINATREGKSNGSYFAIEDYGNEFRDNTIDGNPSEIPLSEVTEAPAVSGIFVYATVHSSAYDNRNIAGDATNEIIEDNTLKNLSAAINISRCTYGQVIRNNRIDSSVSIPYNDPTSSQNTKLICLSPVLQQNARPEIEIWSPEPKVIVPDNACWDGASDAIILFDGKNEDEWVSTDDTSSAGKWIVSNGILTVNKKAGNIQTRRKFNDYQLHLEWRIPLNITGQGQARGNSGVILAATGPGDNGYELQVLDSYNNTYINGQAGSIYNQYAPLVNACKKPGEWQTYDIIWTAPRFNGSGELNSPARVTVFHNGCLIQNNVSLLGPTAYYPETPGYKKHGPSPIKLQAHGDPSEPISYRNIWVREL